MRFLIKLLLVLLYTSNSLAKFEVLSQPLLTQIEDLQVLSMTNENLRYIAWSKATDVHLAVLSDKQMIANIHIADAYQPSLRIEPNWRYGKHAVLIFMYRQGALAEFAELYGLDANKHLIRLDQILAEQIEWRISGNGEPLLTRYTKPQQQLTATCYRFDQQSYKLANSPCDR